MLGCLLSPRDGLALRSWAFTTPFCCPRGTGKPSPAYGSVSDPDLPGWTLEGRVSTQQPHECEVMRIVAAGADEAKGFFGFLLFSLPPLAPSTVPRLFFSCGFDNMFI